MLLLIIATVMIMTVIATFTRMVLTLFDMPLDRRKEKRHGLSSSTGGRPQPESASAGPTTTINRAHA